MDVYIFHHGIGKERNEVPCLLILSIEKPYLALDREKMWEYLKMKKISEHLINRIKELYKNTTTNVRMNGKGVKQGCPLSPSLFASYIGDLQEMFSKL